MKYNNKKFKKFEYKLRFKARFKAILFKFIIYVLNYYKSTIK